MVTLVAFVSFYDNIEYRISIGSKLRLNLIPDYLLLLGSLCQNEFIFSILISILSKC